MREHKKSLEEELGSENMGEFRLSRKEYSDIQMKINKGVFFSCSPAIDRELHEVNRLGKAGYPWRD